MDRLKTDILLLFFQKMTSHKNLSIGDFASIAIEAADQQLIEELKQDVDKNLPVQMMEIIHSVFEKVKLLKAQELTELDQDESSTWIVKEDAVKALKDKSLEFLRNIINKKKTILKLFLKLKELFVKVNKMDMGKVKEADSDTIAKKLNDYEKARLKVDKEKSKAVHKEEKKPKIKSETKIEPKTEQENGHENGQEMTTEVQIVEQKPPKMKKPPKQSVEKEKKPPKTSDAPKKTVAKEKKASKVSEPTQKVIEQEKIKKATPSIQKFFTVKAINVNENNQGYQKYNRYQSIGSFSIKILHKDAGKNNIEELFTNPPDQPIIDLETRFIRRQRPIDAKTTVNKVRFIRFEDYLKEYTEYKGYVLPDRFSAHPPKNQLARFNEAINYDLLTDDELQLLDAESCSRSNDESDEDLNDTIVDDFLVPDDYISDEETDSVKKIKRQKDELVMKMSEELKQAAIDFKKLDENDSLVQRYKIINLTSLPFPLSVIATKPLKPEDAGIDDALFARIVLLSTGMPTKKDVYKLLCEKGIDISKKTVFDKIFESAALCYYVEPNEFETYIKKDYYDTLIAGLRNKTGDILKEFPQYMERLILLTHGSVSNTGTREEKIYRDLKTVYPQMTKLNLEKTIKRIAQVGFVFYPEVLERLHISTIQIVSILQSRFPRQLSVYDSENGYN